MGRGAAAGLARQRPLEEGLEAGAGEAAAEPKRQRLGRGGSGLWSKG